MANNKKDGNGLIGGCKAQGPKMQGWTGLPTTRFDVRIYKPKKIGFASFYTFSDSELKFSLHSLKRKTRTTTKTPPETN